MTALKLDKFGGMLPAWDSRLLPDGQADYSLNAYLFSGSLIGWRQPKLLYQLKDSAAKFVYRIPNRDTNNTAITAQDSFWMEFPNADTTVMRTPVVNDQYQRYYFASPDDVPKYNTYDRIRNDEPSLILGLPASGCAPGVSVNGGGDTAHLGFTPDEVPIGTVGGTYCLGNQIYLIPIIADGSMLITDIAMMPQSSDPNFTYRAVVYSDFNGKPDQLMGYSGPAVGAEANIAIDRDFTNGVPILSNTVYWVGLAMDSSLYFYMGATTNKGYSFSSTFSNGPPEQISPGDLTPGPTWQIWVELQGSSVFEARAYLYTWVTEYGEEGPPSPPSIVQGWSNATWTVELCQPTPEEMTGRNITKTRIYRSVSSQQGVGTYFFVAEVPITQGVYEDTSTDNVVTFND
jgi:hypothetical protein